MEIGEPKARAVEGNNADIELLGEFFRTEKIPVESSTGCTVKEKDWLAVWRTVVIIAKDAAIG
jgi:hypothetical protein